MIKIGSGPPPPHDEPLAALLHCHERMRERLASLERSAAALESGGDPAPAFAAIGEVLAHFEKAGVRHTEDEEGSVWPRVRGAVDEQLLDDLTTEHRAVEAIHLALRDTATRAVPGEAAVHARAYATAYREHLRREEEELFPAIARLDAAELRAIGIEMRLRRG